jgi:NAD(P)-dependent dehydrogenase (short-subunit alcohol dehydrogenase family)
MAHWTLNDAPSQDGRVAIVTGANIGLGYETALGFAKLGATVILACRNLDKAGAAQASILEAVPDANVEVRQLDLSSMDSVRAFAEGFLAAYDRLDLLVNNAGVMMCPRMETADGFELQLGVNFLGHFLLTGLLMARLEATDGARVVALSSNAHKTGRIDLDDLMSERSYGKFEAYCQSKLACLMHALELQHRLTEKGSSVLAVAAHPGMSATNLVQWMPSFIEQLAPWFIQDAEAGAQPTLYAALGSDIEGGDYTGPAGLLEVGGPPVKVRPVKRAFDRDVSAALWERSQELTGVRYP